MPVVLQLNDAHKRYGDQALLDGASCALADDQKVGLIGRNGAGKSTLCRILLGDEELDAGEVVRSRKLRLGYLRQHDPFHAGETVREFLMRDSGQPDWRCGEVAWQFQFPDAVLDRPVRELSGGWQTRAKLAALLLHDPNLLILDEPTNFLDLRTQMLLEWFLRDFRAGCLIVSHDREFLKRNCTHTLELARGQLTMYPGDVDAYLANVAERREHDERVNATTLAKRRQLETFIAKNRAKASTASQAKSKAKQLERLELIHIEGAGDRGAISLSRRRAAARAGGADASTWRSAIPDHTVARDVHVEIDHGSRVGVVGDNGQGKTTFLRTVCGSLAAAGGRDHLGLRLRGRRVRPARVHARCPRTKTVLEYLEYQAAPMTGTQQIKDVAGSLLFSGELIEKKIRVLSGGERARLVLAGLLLQKAQRAGARRAGQPPRRGIGRSAGRGADFVPRHGDLHQPRPALHAPRGDARDRSASGPRGELPGELRRLCLPRAKRNRQRPARAAHAGLAAAEGQRCQRPLKQMQPPVDRKAQARQDREAQKKLKALERKIARLDEDKRATNDALLSVTETAEAQRLARSPQGTDDGAGTRLEDEWLALSEELETT